MAHTEVGRDLEAFFSVMRLSRCPASRFIALQRRRRQQCDNEARKSPFAGLLLVFGAAMKKPQARNFGALTLDHLVSFLTQRLAAQEDDYDDKIFILRPPKEKWTLPSWERFSLGPQMGGATTLAATATRDKCALATLSLACSPLLLPSPAPR